jgi:hypothetical protein
LIAHGVFLRIVCAAVEREPAFIRVAALQLVLAKRIQKVELHSDGDGLGCAFDAVAPVALDGLGVVGQAPAVITSGKPETALDPGLQHRARMPVAIGTPAVKKLNVAAPQAGAGGSLVLRPFVEPKFHGDIFVKYFAASDRIVDQVKLGEQSPISGVYAVDFKRLRIFLKIDAGNRPRGEIAAVKGVLGGCGGRRHGMGSRRGRFRSNQFEGKGRGVKG